MDKPPIKKPLISSIEQPEEKIEKSEFVLENGEKPLFEMEIELDASKRTEEYLQEIQDLGYSFGSGVLDEIKNIKPLDTNKKLSLVSFTPKQLGCAIDEHPFFGGTTFSASSMNDVRLNASKFGLKCCPEQVFLQLCVDAKKHLGVVKDRIFLIERTSALPLDNEHTTDLFKSFDIHLGDDENVSIGIRQFADDNLHIVNPNFEFVFCK